MPELPEVETVRIGLSSLLPGKVVKTVSFDTPKSFPNGQSDVDQFLIGARIVTITRRAKVLVIELSSKYSLVIHLKMTGQLVYRGEKRFGAGHPSKSLVGELPDKSTRVTITFSDDSQLFFNDQRKFGWMRLLPTAEVPQIDFFKKVGPEPLASNFKPKDFIARIRRRPKSNIKSVLLDQSVIAGVGNIYSDESLWGARIHPATLVSKLSDAKLKALFHELKYVLELSIAKGGSTDRNYVDAQGRRSSYLSFARVFRRQNQSCLRHPETNIKKIRVAGRGTHICPKCQKLPKVTA